MNCLRYIFSLNFVLFAYSVSYAGAIDWANGTWELAPSKGEKTDFEKEFTCNANALVIKIDKVNHRYRSETRDFDTSYADITFSSDDFIVIKYDNEDRVMDNGQPHVWIMYFNNPDEFVWVREDWLEDGQITATTSGRIRCKVPVS